MIGAPYTYDTSLVRWHGERLQDAWSEGSVMQFAGGNLVFYAIISDEADPVLSDTAMACVGWEAAKQWG